MKPVSIRPLDLALALLVILVWGLNFAVIKVGVEGIPPFLLGALRFSVAAFPAVLLCRPPKLPLRLYVLYGLFTSVMQFALLFSAIHVGMPSGLASLVLQSQAFFTMAFSVLWLKESWQANQLVGLLLAAVGLMVIGSAHGAALPLLGFVLTVAAACAWALGNIVARQMRAYAPFNQLAFVVWASLVPPLPFLALSYALEGPQAISQAWSQLGLRSVGAVAYLGWMATLLGYGVWTYLLGKYPANRIAPFSMLVPVVGLSVGWLAFGEALHPLQWLGAGLLMAGLLVNLFGHHAGMRWLTRARAS